MRGELAPLKAPGPDRGDAIEIDPSQVQPITLLLHELVANAHRHGALSVAEGGLSIAWGAIRPHASCTTPRGGGPPPTRDRSPGSGQTMIAAITSRQLRGRIDYVWSDAGLTVVVAIPCMALG